MERLEKVLNLADFGLKAACMLANTDHIYHGYDSANAAKVKQVLDNAQKCVAAALAEGGTP